ncbi:hypothetical protein [Indiicoccus explosivorum]|uniref:hypothetical protein n=1 Tax=Indiicoccus explosivorum TaxID=1917864 RepID=UPI000B447DB5|nr:hypothetical protein [Indiicoccus explosivorum]
MSNKLKSAGVLLLSLWIMAGCSPEQTAEETAEHREARQAAWNFVQEMGWAGTLDESSWETAAVERIVAPDYYEYVDASFEGEEVLLITFPEEGEPVASVTHFLVDKETNEVVGFLPGA